MVSWIKNTASVTASICIVLAGPMVHLTWAQDTDRAANQSTSINSLAPEVWPIVVEPDLELQKAVAARARKIAENKKLLNSIRALPSVLIDDSLPTSESRTNENRPLNPGVATNTETVKISVAKNVRPSKSVGPTLATVKQSSTNVAPTPNSKRPMAKDGVSTELENVSELNDVAHVASSLIERGPRLPLNKLNLTSRTGLPPIIQASEMPVVDNDDAPTVIIRPSADGSTPIKDCHMEVKKIGDLEQDEYAVMLEVPDSIKVIEVVPNQTADSKRDFRLRLEPRREFESLVAEKSKTPAIKISNGNQVISRQQEFNMPNLLKPVPHLRPLPTAPTTELPGRNGFQKNPFFQTEPNRRDPKTTQDSAEPSDSQSVQVAYQNANESTQSVAANVPYTSDEPVEPTLATNVAESVVIAASLRTELTGPPAMKLGDTGDFTIVVSNQTQVTTTDVQVILNVPSALDVLVLDRKAWIDQSERTVTWRLPTLVSGDEAVIHYRVQASLEGDIRQQISVHADGAADTNREQREFSSGAEIETRVSR